MAFPCCLSSKDVARVWGSSGNTSFTPAPKLYFWFWEHLLPPIVRRVSSARQSPSTLFSSLAEPTWALMSKTRPLTSAGMAPRWTLLCQDWAPPCSTFFICPWEPCGPCPCHGDDTRLERRWDLDFWRLHQTLAQLSLPTGKNIPMNKVAKVEQEETCHPQ